MYQTEDFNMQDNDSSSINTLFDNSLLILTLQNFYF